MAASVLDDQATVAVTPPLRYPVSMLLREVADAEVAALIREEEAMRTELPNMREQRRLLKVQRDTLQRNRKVARSKAHLKYDNAIHQLHAERRRLQAMLDEHKAQQGTRTTARDRVGDLECAMRIAARLCEDAEAQLLQQQEQLERGTGVGKPSEQKKAVERCRKEWTARVAEKAQREAEYTKARVELSAATPDFAERNARDEEVRDLRAKLNAVMEQLEAVNQQRRLASTAQLGETDEIEQTAAELADMDAALVAADARLADIRAALFPESQHFTYNPEFHPALMGRGGATLRQLQEDFGVAICVDAMPPGHGYVVGGAAEAAACVEAIAAIMLDEEAKNAAATLTFTDPQLRKELIGPRGATVERFQDEYEVHMQMSDSGVIITGRRHDVAEAVEAVRSYLESFTTREMAITAAALPALLGRGGRNIARISDGSGVRALRVDREHGVVRATGSPDAIERAFALCRSATGEGDGATKVVHADGAWVGAVIGQRGATIRQIEEETDAHVQCTGTTISLTGTLEAVSRAYERVVALRRAERSIPADFKRLHFLTAPIVAVDHSCSSPTAGSPTAGSPTTSTARGGSSFITPLEAVRRAAQCDQVVPLRAEGCVMLRGAPEAVECAYGLLKLLLRHNNPFSINVAFLDILRSFMTERRREWGNKNLLDYIPSLFAAPVRIDVDWTARRLTVSSCSTREARAATSKLVACLRDYIVTHVRLISNFPEYAISRLLGTRGSTIRQLQEATDTEIVLVRDRAQVQVLNAAGNVEKLELAVHAIRAAVFGDEDEEEEEDVEGVVRSSAEAVAAQTPPRGVAMA